MRSKLTLSIDNQTIKKAKNLAEKRGSSVSKMFADFIEQNSRIEKKLSALKEVSGILNADLAAEPGAQYTEKINIKHGW